MKKSILSFICFLFTTSANAQYVIDWKNAPLNPNPVHFTLNHENITGPVKIYENIILPFVSITYSFDEKGRMIVYDKATMTYDTQGFLAELKSNKASRTFKNNKNGYIISSHWKSSGKERNIAYEYNKKGLYVQQIDLDTNAVLEKYDYDSNNRVIKYELWRNGKIFSTKTYSYSKEGDFLKAMITSTDEKGSSAETNYFDSKGNNYKSNKNLQPVYDSYGNRLHFKNPTTNEITAEQKFHYYPKK